MPPRRLNISPYEMLIVGSLVQKEAQPADFAKVARVIYNRLASDYDRLEFDSTVNYPLDRQEVATTDEDRAKETPWNTYAKTGLPATPICSPGDGCAGGGREARAGGLAVLRDRRHRRHHAVHQRLPGAPGEPGQGTRQRRPRLRAMNPRDERQ